MPGSSNTTSNGLQDIGSAALWSAEDERDFDYELQKVRDYYSPFPHRNPALETFEKKLDRVFNDQTARFEKSGKVVEPLHQTEPKADLVVNSGLVRIAQLVTGKSNAYFTFMASGTGVAQERPSDIRLASENARVSMLTSGFVEAVGTAVKMVGKFASFLPSALITESGAFDIGTPNFGTMFYRTVYPQGSRIEHVQGRTFYSCMQTVSQVSVT